jgi:hypothetical protein
MIAGLTAGLPLVKGRPPQNSARWINPDLPGNDKVVFLAGSLTDEDRITLTSALPASGHPGVVLFDSHDSEFPTEVFLKEYRVARIIPVGSFPQGARDVQERLHCQTMQVQAWQPGKTGGLWQALFPRPHRLVVCPAEPRRLLLQAACLAAAIKAPLFIDHGQAEDADNLRRCLKDWPIQEVVLAGSSSAFGYRLPAFSRWPIADCRWPIAGSHPRIHRLQDEAAVSAAYLRQIGKNGPIKNLVVANPDDTRPGRGGMSVLAPMIALNKNAALLLTCPGGDNVEALVEQAGKDLLTQAATSIILVGNLQAIPMQRRPNPLPGGKDRAIDMEPMTPHGKEPFSYSVGRLFHEDLNVVALMLARPRLWKDPPVEFNALVVSNPGGSLPLLETFSRNTAQELANAGFDTTALFGHEARRALIRKLLPKQSLFLWEGHHSTLVRDFEVPDWTEPLRPSLIFLQSCLALTENEALPFLRRGACGVIGSSSRTYSASGGAMALAYCDALLYEHLPLGEALRHAKNYMLAFTLLKEKRLGSGAKLSGATIRSAWAFTLWGDPTLELPMPRAPDHALPRVRHQVEGNVIRIVLPDLPHEKASSGRYQTQMWANARLGGLLTAQDDARKLRPLVFAEVHLPHGPAGKTPNLHGRLPGKNWVFCWDGRRQCGYLLAMPRTTDSELRFHVRWQPVDSR